MPDFSLCLVELGALRRGDTVLGIRRGGIHSDECREKAGLRARPKCGGAQRTPSAKPQPDAGSLTVGSLLVATSLGRGAEVGARVDPTLNPVQAGLPLDQRLKGKRPPQCAAKKGGTARRAVRLTDET